MTYLTGRQICFCIFHKNESFYPVSPLGWERWGGGGEESLYSGQNLLKFTQTSPIKASIPPTK